MRRFHIKTFGCQMNEHDSRKIAGLLRQQGYEPTKKLSEADLVLFNTCTVRQKAHQKAFSEIGKVVGEKRGRTMIGVCGCVAQEEGARLIQRFPEIDLVFGPDQIHQLPTLIDLVESRGKPAIATELINSPEDYHFLEIVAATKLHGPTAYVTIMKGCNSHCSYCIVPKVRGTEVYRTPREILREIELLVEKGCKEVTLLGQNVNSYGQQAKDGITFAKLIRLISKETVVQRIRFTSPHPKDCKEDLVQEYAENEKLCSHIHLPLQSGADSVLKRMQRAYNMQTFKEKVEKLRKARLGIAITTDMIVGFPGESEEEFQTTLDRVREIQFDNMYAFKYSPRPDTKAYTIKDDVSLSLKEERLAQLLTLQKEISEVKNKVLEGSIESVLVEGRDKRGREKLTGRTSSNKIVNFPGQEGLINAIVEVKVVKSFPFSLEGELVHGCENREKNI